MKPHSRGQSQSGWVSGGQTVGERHEVFALKHFAFVYIDYLPFHPTGIIAAATPSVPLSVLSRLKLAAAFLVSMISTLTPKLERSSLVFFVIGRVIAPVPMIKRSGRG